MTLMTRKQDPFHGSPKIHCIKDSTRITVFEGGHEILHVPALNWLARQRRGRPATWDVFQNESGNRNPTVDNSSCGCDNKKKTNPSADITV